MPPHNQAVANDASPPTLVEQFKLSVMRELQAHPMNIAFDEMSECLKRGDTAGFDAARRIFWNLKASTKGSNNG